MMDEMSFVVTTLERINSKLDKHDDKIDMIVLAMQQLVKVDTENKELKESQVRIFRRLEIVEQNQNTDGCSAHKNFVRVREEQVKNYDSVIDRCKSTQVELETRLAVLEQKPMKAFDKVWMAVLGALGAGVGGWVLLKFGISVK